MASGKSRDSLYYCTAKMLSSILHLTHYKQSLHSNIKTLSNMSLTKFLYFNNVYKPPHSSQTKPDWVLIPNVPYIFPSMFFSSLLSPLQLCATLLHILQEGLLKSILCFSIFNSIVLSSEQPQHLLPRCLPCLFDGMVTWSLCLIFHVK